MEHNNLTWEELNDAARSLRLTIEFFKSIQHHMELDWFNADAHIREDTLCAGFIISASVRGFPTYLMAKEWQAATNSQPAFGDFILTSNREVFVLEVKDCFDKDTGGALSGKRRVDKRRLLKKQCVYYTEAFRKLYNIEWPVNSVYLDGQDIVRLTPAKIVAGKLSYDGSKALCATYLDCLLEYYEKCLQSL